MIKIPYIKKGKRAKIDGVVNALAHSIETVGETNYAITKFLHKVIQRDDTFNYDLLNAIIGVLECAKLELYRMVVGPYEQRKIKENGCVSELDDHDM